MRRHLLLLPATVFAGLVLAACGGSGGTPNTQTSAPAASNAPTATASPTPGSPASGGSAPSAGTASVTITITNYAYTSPASVGPGAKITVRNTDDVAHTVTADAGGFNVTVPASGTAMLTAPSAPGSYPFHCTYHANMHGTLTVR